MFRDRHEMVLERLDVLHYARVIALLVDLALHNNGPHRDGVGLDLGNIRSSIVHAPLLVKQKEPQHSSRASDSVLR